jgi:hypothetical protein
LASAVDFLKIKRNVYLIKLHLSFLSTRKKKSHQIWGIQNKCYQLAFKLNIALSITSTVSKVVSYY